MFYRTQAAERADKINAVFVTGDNEPLTFDLDLETPPSEEPNTTRLPCEFGVNPFSGSRCISYTNKKNTDRWRQKQNLPQFTARGKTVEICSPMINYRRAAAFLLFIRHLHLPPEILNSWPKHCWESLPPINVLYLLVGLDKHNSTKPD